MEHLYEDFIRALINGYRHSEETSKQMGLVGMSDYRYECQQASLFKAFVERAEKLLEDGHY